MKVKALKSFGATIIGVRYNISEGDVFEMPPGVDWLKAGLVEKVGGVRKRTTATRQPKETAVRVSRSTKQSTKKDK